MEQVVFRGRFDERAGFVPEDPARWTTARKQRAGQRVEVVLRNPRSKRSLDQNAWHWSIAVPMIAEALGYDKHEHDQVHYALVSKCFGVRQDAKLGEVPNARSSRLTVQQFSELMEWEVRFAAQFCGVEIPLPSEVGLLE